MSLKPATAPVVAAIGAAVWFLLVDWRRLERLDFPAYDSAYFQQLVWGLGRGAWFHASFLPGSFLGLHFSPLLGLPALLELTWPRVEVLMALSAISLALVAPAAFLALRALLPTGRTTPWLAAGLAAGLPFSPILQEAARSGFHTEQLALPGLLFAVWAGLRGRPWLACAAALIALAAKEDQAYQVALLGAVLFVVGRGVVRRLGAGILIAACGWALVTLFVAMPWLRAGQPTDTASYYSWLGEWGLAVLQRRVEVWGALTATPGWQELAVAVAALAFLPLLRPSWLLVALPPFVAALLSRHWPQPALHLQYGLSVVFPLVVAAGLGGHRLSRQLDAWDARAAFATAFLPALLLGVVVGNLAPAIHGQLPRRGPELASARDAAAMVPQGADLTVDDNVATAVASRSSLHLLPALTEESYVIVELGAQTPSYGEGTARDRVVAELSATRRLLWSDGRIRLWSPSFRTPTHPWN